MTEITFTPLIEKALQDEDFGNRLIAFARAHGIELLKDAELADEELADVAGGIIIVNSRTATYKLSYAPKEIPGDTKGLDGPFI